MIFVKLSCHEPKLICFKSYYIKNNKFIFKSVLELKKEREVIKTEIELFPLRKDELIEMLKHVGFSRFSKVEVCGDFDESKYTVDSKAIVICAGK